MLDLDRFRLELAGACEDAGVAPGSLAVFVVAAARPPGTTPVAYLHPAGRVRPDTVAVFREVGPERARRTAGRHRLALWHELPGIPPVALGAMLRHELEHARRWERSGTRFFEADELLRAAVRGSDADGDGYRSLPSELEANAAASAYARRVLAGAQLAELRACPDCAALLDPGPAYADVVGATLAELGGRSDWMQQLDAAHRRAYLEEVRAACAVWDEKGARGRSAGGEDPELQIVAPAL